MPKQKHTVILADPPWKYGQSCATKAFRGGAVKHYQLMKMEEIAALPVEEIAADNSALFLWATMPLLPEAIAVMEFWGFEYKTCAFTWIKTTKAGRPAIGVGHYTRANAELCLLGTRGRVKPLLQVNNTSSVVMTPRQKHSQKPVEVRQRIDRMFGNVPKVELFARMYAPGWHSWGNEVDCDIDLGEKDE